MRICARAWTLIAAVVTAPVAAQEVVPSRLSLADALEIAQGNNPSFLQTRNDEALADWDVRQAYGALLPTASANTGVSWQGAGEQRFGSLTLGDLGFGNQPSYYFSNYNVGLNFSLDWAKLKEPSRARAQRGATVAQIRVAGANLASQVTNAYVALLREQERLRLADPLPSLDCSRFVFSDDQRDRKSVV
jgi:outer membrane protein TolC